jgi:hypothetical protein
VRQHYSTLLLLLLLLLLLQVYSVKDSNLCLTGTAEVPLAGVYMDKVLNEKVRCAYTTQFMTCMKIRLIT